VDEILECIDTESIATRYFQIHTLNELQQPIESVKPFLQELDLVIPDSKFVQINRAVLHHNARGKIKRLIRFRRIARII
jgi:hypothetical protein